jgi:uncharacterized protein YhhL (DUF1145 family)
MLKAGLLVMYALTLAGLAGLLPAELATTLQTITLITLVIHLVEAAVVFKHVRLYRGPLAISVLLTLLFGLLHWKPLADARTKP